jgi:hypothetical protein
MSSPDAPDAESASSDEVAEIQRERERRLDPANRPDNAEVDNTDAELPTVEAFNRHEAEERAGAAQGTADPGEKFRRMEVSEQERAEIEQERERRLDPGNRPDNAEVDNTGDGMPEIAREENQPE